MIYLDNAATTFPKPESVYAEAMRVMRSCGGNPGRGSHQMALAAAEEVYRTREAVADFFGSRSPERVVLTQNATHALNVALRGILRQGDHILFSELSHNSVRRPILALAKERGLRYDVYRGFGRKSEIMASICSKLRPETRVIEVTVRSNITSVGLPLQAIAALCRERGLILVVDASQAAGTMPLSIAELGSAVICAPGHKGLYGLPGSGFALFSDDIEPTSLQPFMVGGSGIHSREAEMPDLLPERLEAGTLNAPAAASLRAGIEYVKQIGASVIDAHEASLRRRLTELLLRLPNVRVYRPDGNEGGIVLFSVAGYSSSEVGRYLDRQGICVRSGLHCAPLAHKAIGSPDGGAVRVSFSAFNTESDAIAVWQAIREMR